MLPFRLLTLLGITGLRRIIMRIAMSVRTTTEVGEISHLLKNESRTMYLLTCLVCPVPDMVSCQTVY